MIYRILQIEEAEAFWDMMNQLDYETKFMLYEPGEREKNEGSIASIRRLIQSAAEGRNFLLAAEADGQIVGYIFAERGGLSKVKHTAYIVTGVREKYRGRNIGKTFFEYLDLWAKRESITRLELTVMCPNTIARQLYEKNGFVVEGIKKNSIYMDGQYVDEFYMAKII